MLSIIIYFSPRINTFLDEKKKGLYNQRKSDIIIKSVPADEIEYGPIAQLGERTVRIRKVVGSIPIRSTILRKITANSAVIFHLTTLRDTGGEVFLSLIMTT